MSGMTGVNLHINEAKVLANECISNIEQCRRKKIVLLDKLLDEHLRAYEKLDWFSRLLGDIPSRSTIVKGTEAAKANIKVQYLEIEVLADDILTAIEHSASPYIYISATDLGFLAATYH
jgi:hypothetical protein